MAPTFVQEHHPDAVFDSTLTITNVDIGSGANRTLVVVVHLRDYNAPAPTVSSVVFNTSENLTFRSRATHTWGGSSQYSEVTEIWTRDNPSNATANVVVTASKVCNWGLAATALEYTGANNSVGANTGSATGTGTSLDTNITTGASTSLIIAGATNDVYLNSVTPGGSTVERADHSDGNAWVGELAASGGADTVHADLTTWADFAVSAIELLAAAGGDFTISATDAISLGESSAVRIPEDFINVSDGLTLGESSTIEKAGPGEIVVSDSLSLGESSAVHIPEYFINVSDGVTVGEVSPPTVSISGGADTIDVTSPVSYRVFQRISNLGNIAISGTYTGTPAGIEASFNGGAYATIVASPAGGTFSGTLTGQTQGQGTLTIRFTDNTAVTDTVTYIGIGDVFIVGGQSNAVGYASGNLTYSHATLKAGMFGNDYNWKELVDPLDSNINQVDAVSNDGSFGGSCWLPLATLFMADQNVPCAFVPCALADTSIDVWLPGADHQDRTTLYGSMIYRALQTGCKVILWWQGETDIVNPMNPDTYNSNLDTIANAVMADLGVKLMPCTIQDLSTVYEGFDESVIDAHIREAWNDNANVAPGPDFEDYNFPVGVLHYDTSDAPAIAQYWWDALFLEFYGIRISIDPNVYAGAGWSPGVRLY